MCMMGKARELDREQKEVEVEVEVCGFVGVGKDRRFPDLETFWKLDMKHRA